ncbi:hypothetical protein INT43_002266 [Umbelopsis isabellina]|uniref:THO complex subunit 1 n=1 Tax=Mortierella isabellina TaxID=91625 RepID=A0A8H7UP17_MORIS|nr:hypothetical protein INT43_002266 [Umbelopsis isabellina]
MPEFDAFRVKAQSALTHCLTEAQAYRAKAQVQDVPFSFFQPLIDQQIAPLVGPDNGANVQLSADPKHDWRKNALELIYRQTLYDIVISYEEPDDTLFQQIFDCLDIVLLSSESGYVEPVTVLTLIEELLEQQTIHGCEKLFEYIESRKTKLTVNMVPGKGKGLVLLRMCNEMLRRLSKNMSTVFCGRILMFLANSFPLGERSGVNLRGEFNVENVVKYDSEEELKDDPRLTDEQKTFYTLFWSTQSFLTNPPSIFADDNFQKFQKGVETTMSKFNDMSQREAVVAGSSADHAGKDSVSRKRSADEMDVDDSFTEEAVRDVYNEYFFPRFLTSRELLELELADISFRRTVLVQFLIALQYLDGYRSAEVEKTQAILAAKGGKPLAAQNLQKLTEEQESWISETRKEILKELQASNPHGREYTRIVELVLAHERNWILWKSASCPPFEMPPIEPNDFANLINSKRRKLTATLPPYRFEWGNSEITALYHRTLGRHLTDMMSELSDLPTALNYLNDVLPKLQNSKASVEARHEIANAVLFQVMRLLFLKEAHLVSKVFMAKKELMKVAREKAALAAKSSESGEVSEDVKAEDPSSITDKSVEFEIRVLQQAIKIISEDEEARRSNAAKAATNETSAPTQSSASPALSSPPKTTEIQDPKEGEVSKTTEGPASDREVPNSKPTQSAADEAGGQEITKSDPMEADPQPQSDLPAQEETQVEGEALKPKQEEGEMQLDTTNETQQSEVTNGIDNVAENITETVSAEEDRNVDAQNADISETTAEETVKGSAMEVDDIEAKIEDVATKEDQTIQ